METVKKISDEDMRNIALAEYYYFSGRPDEASYIVENYLTAKDLAVSLSTCLIYAFANLDLDKILRTKQAIIHIFEAAESADENNSPQYKSYAVFIYVTASVLLHLPLPKDIDSTKHILPMLPTGIRLFALYIKAHALYLNGQYVSCIAVAETALTLEEKNYPISSIYLHLAAVMGYVNIKDMKSAKYHLLEAWKIAQPDDMIKGFSEHHGLLGGMLESVMKRDYPDEFKRIINITHCFSVGWRKHIIP
ncbi:MAG: hypothetical protein LUD77_05150 [Clostridiales bacterium]|nr:hypothetical protein [Clostridiales bacterium]